MTAGEEAGEGRVSTPEEVLSLEGIDVWASGRQILRDVSFAVRAGGFAGVSGANGAGKTTMFRVILGLQPSSAGRVVVCGTTSKRPQPGRIGYVPQKVVLEPDTPLRVKDFVALGLDGHKLGLPLPSRERRERVDEMVAAVGAEHLATQRVGMLSGGELQRVLIAHALASGPKLLILDEPLANLDLKSEQEVVDLLARLAREQRVAVLLAAHDMNPLLPVMDRVVYVAGGQVATGTADEVIRPDVLSSLYGHPISVIKVEGRIIVVAGSDVRTVTGPSSATDAAPVPASGSGETDGASPASTVAPS